MVSRWLLYGLNSRAGAGRGRRGGFMPFPKGKMNVFVSLELEELG